MVEWCHYRWRFVTIVVPQRLELVPFVYADINDLDENVHGLIIKFANNAIRVAVNEEGCKRIKQDIDHLQV